MDTPSNRSAIRQANIEIKALEKEIGKLENLNGGKFKSLFDQLKSAVPGLEMIANPLLLGSAEIFRLKQAFIVGSYGSAMPAFSPDPK